MEALLVTNGGSAAVFLGPAGVTTTTGYSLAAGATVNVPTTGAATEALYGIVTTGTATVGYLFPG